MQERSLSLSLIIVGTPVGFSPDSYVHACYSDIPTLFGDRGLDDHKWAYSGDEKAVEYPVVMGAVMWATSWLVPESSHAFRTYFDVNVFFLALIFIGVVLLVWRIRPQYAYLLPLSSRLLSHPSISIGIFGESSQCLPRFIISSRENI
ncbi:MAG: hypothetical protein WDO06_05640 [Actinomycetota bacterium]